MPHESGWFIDDIELPVAPQSDERNIARTFQSETLFNFFPQLTKSTARSFDYTLKGIIYPEGKALALDQIARSADTNIVVITIPVDQLIFNVSKYAVKNLVISRKGPLFVKYSVDGLPPFETVQAVPFVLTLTELPDEGEFQEGIDGFTDADEGALGTQQINEIIEGTDLEGISLPEIYRSISLYTTLVGQMAI